MEPLLNEMPNMYKTLLKTFCYEEIRASIYHLMILLSSCGSVKKIAEKKEKITVQNGHFYKEKILTIRRD